MNLSKNYVWCHETLANRSRGGGERGAGVSAGPGAQRCPVKIEATKASAHARIRNKQCRYPRTCIPDTKSPKIKSTESPTSATFDSRKGNEKGDERKTRRDANKAARRWDNRRSK